MKTVVISTIYAGDAVKQAIQKLSPDKLILLIDEPKDKNKKEDMTKTINLIGEFFKNSLVLETKKISPYNIPEIMGEVIKTIDKEFKEGNRILIHTTEGRKTASFALLFAGYRRKDKVDGAYYITEEEHNLIKLPMLEFDINDTKKALLREISKGNGHLNELQKKVELKQSATYQNIQELKKQGYLEDSKELVLTDLGKIMIL